MRQVKELETWKQQVGNLLQMIYIRFMVLLHCYDHVICSAQFVAELLQLTVWDQGRVSIQSQVRCSIREEYIDCSECCHVFVCDTIRCDNILEYEQSFVVDGWGDIQQWRSDSSIGWRLLHLHANIL